MARAYFDESRLSRANAGERHTFEWLRDCLPSEYDIFHEPPISGKRPDIVVFGPRIGLVVLEVKDWNVGSIESVAPGESVTLVGGKTKSHPIEQANGHVNAIRKMLERTPDCVNSGGAFQGRILFPTSKACVFWNLTRGNVDALGLATGYERGWVLSGDEIGTPGAWAFDQAGSVTRLSEAMNIVFKWSSSDLTRQAVRQILAPDRVIPQRFSEVGKKPPELNQLQLGLTIGRELSEEQRTFAKEGLGTFRQLQGVVGSGKTEVVITRAILYASAHPSHRLLVLCFNVSLASWLRKRIFLRGDLQSRAIDVANFHDWARDLLDRAGFALSRGDFSDGRFEKQLLEAIEGGIVERRYDAVIIDEGQDFSATMLRVVSAILDKDRKSLFIAMDNAQRIYDNQAFPLSDVGLVATGKSRVLKVNERCSREINDFSRRFMWGDATPGTGLPVAGQTVWIPISSQRHGDPVTVARCSSLRHQVEWAAQWVLSLLVGGSLPDEIAVLYARSFSGVDGEPLDRQRVSGADPRAAVDLAALIREVFQDQGIGTWWLAEDRSSKADATVSHSRVTLSTISSFKGLEAKNVVLFGCDATIEGKATQAMKDRSLLYVGMTRSTHRLAVPWTRADGFGPALAALPDVNSVEGILGG